MFQNQPKKVTRVSRVAIFSRYSRNKVEPTTGNAYCYRYRTSISSLDSRLTGSPGSSKAASLGYASASELAQIVHMQQQLNESSSRSQQQQHMIIKPPMLPPKGNNVQQPPYIAPPLYENLQDVSTFSINGKREPVFEKNSSLYQQIRFQEDPG